MKLIHTKYREVSRNMTNSISLEKTIKASLLALSALLVLSWGCATSEPSKFYVLTPLSSQAKESVSKEKAATGHGTKDGSGTTGLGVGPIKFPDYLDRPQIVTRTGNNQLSLNEFHRWAGSLRDDIGRILIENLSILLGTDRVVLYPWRNVTPVEYQITLEIIRFDGEPGKEAVLTVLWSFYGEGGKKFLAMKKSTYQEPVQGTGYDDFVSAQSKAIAAFSRDVAAELVHFSSPSPVNTESNK